MNIFLELFESDWSLVAVWFAGIWAVIKFIRQVSKNADDDLVPEKRQLIANYLIKLDSVKSYTWVPHFNYIFDSFFGEKHFTWKCFYRSTLISFFTSTFLILFFSSILHEKISLESEIVFQVLFIPLLTNIFLDYISLLETRYIMALKIPTFFKIIIDLLLTFLLVLVWIFLLRYMLLILILPDGIVPEGYFTISGILDNIYIEIISLFSPVFTPFPEVPEIKTMNIISIVFFTSLTTSLWLWLHGLSQLTIKLISTTTSLTKNWLNIEEQPIRSIGKVINTYILIFGVILFPVYMYFNS